MDPNQIPYLRAMPPELRRTYALQLAVNSAKPDEMAGDVVDRAAIYLSFLGYTPDGNPLTEKSAMEKAEEHLRDVRSKLSRPRPSPPGRI